ncbi:hypothetical protein BO78DRAFT_443449 [Aspergillus sclerotiicarbonarius CBS 121057]|uniref:Uncharacterized protein n=1 Tax=Aspergillus sclerotiicarbonarius (strain CBS 121057 / IBT 28362) TaxID=1448318 RepID=A0A319EAX1_ASPSB|nr:hypothetical protein BO78DRAFT_443449 [Aspergillus sclerotiicarbonarius CBS 121057]
MQFSRLPQSINQSITFYYRQVYPPSTLKSTPVVYEPASLTKQTNNQTPPSTPSHDMSSPPESSPPHPTLPSVPPHPQNPTTQYQHTQAKHYYSLSQSPSTHSPTTSPYEYTPLWPHYIIRGFALAGSSQYSMARDRRRAVMMKLPFPRARPWRSKTPS